MEVLSDEEEVFDTFDVVALLLLLLLLAPVLFVLEELVPESVPLVLVLVELLDPLDEAEELDVELVFSDVAELVGVSLLVLSD